MSQSVEVSGPDIESAIAEALGTLGVRRDQVQVEVLEEPIRRLLGLGTRPARLRVTVADGVSVIATPAVPDVISPPPAIEAVTVAAVVPVAMPVAVPAPVEPIAAPPEIHDQTDRAFVENEDDHSPHPVTLTDNQREQEAQVGTEIVRQMLDYLGVTATVATRWVDAVDGRDSRQWVLEISGESLAMLIGSRGETLGALQYLTRLIASRRLGHRVNMVIDVAGYKSHREDMLRRLARRMASQVVETNRAVSLEPMPAHERRIIHMTLRDHPSVKTESVGEGQKRKVTIVPRRARS